MVNKPAEAHALHTSANYVTFGNHKKHSAVSNQQSAISNQPKLSPRPNLLPFASFASVAAKAVWLTAEC
jgi:hypothetical protein